MADHHYFEYLRQGVECWNDWRDEHPEHHPDLAGVNLEGAELEGINLQGVNLEGANLKWANLRHACCRGGNLSQADLRMADLQMADLKVADLTRADLQGAILADADLREACLVNANLCSANLTGAKLYTNNRDGWQIEGIVCAYIFLDANGSQRTPARRHFRPQEFERCAKHPFWGSLFSTPLLQRLLWFFSWHSFHRHEPHSHS